MDGHAMSDFLEKNPWQALRQFTQARIALGRAGNSVPTAPLLAFDLAHAQARDAVHHPLDADVLHEQLRAHGFTSLDVHSAAPDREHYLRRPDLGRRLSADSRDALRTFVPQSPKGTSCGAGDFLRGAGEAPDVVFVIADGLSAFAASKQAIPVLLAGHPKLADWKVGP